MVDLIEMKTKIVAQQVAQKIKDLTAKASKSLNLK